MVCLLLCLGMATGCSRKPAPEPVKTVDVEAKLQKVMTELDRLMMETNLTPAIVLIENTWKDPEFAAQRGWLFSILLDLNMRSERLKEAEDLYLKSIGDVELARAGFEVLGNYYQAQTNRAMALEWTQKLLQVRLPVDLQERAFVWRSGIIREKRGIEGLLPLVAEAMTRFDAPATARIVGEMLGALLAKERYADARTILAELEKKTPLPEVLQYLVAKSSTRISAREERWPDLETDVGKAISLLPDTDLDALLAEVITQARRKNAMDVADRLARLVIDSKEQKPSARRQAAHQWLEVPRDKNLPAEVAARMDAMMSVGLAPSALLGLFDRHFYWVMQFGKPADLSAMIATADKLLPLMKEGPDRTSVRAMIVDGTFVTQDYERSVKLLEEGIPERSAEWHAMALNKVRAHIALKAGRNEEAIQRFRDFMKTVEKWEKPEQDPSTGILYTREMTLGRNAKRIAEILESMGEKEKAAAAVKEARAYFETALKDPQIDTQEKDIINKELEGLPSAP